MAELMARMNPQAISFKESPFAVPATVTSPSTSALRSVVPLHATQQIESAVGDRRGDDRREAATGMDVDIVASTQNYGEGELLSPTAAEEGPPQQGQSSTTMDEVIIPETEDFKV